MNTNPMKETEHMMEKQKTLNVIANDSSHKSQIAWVGKQDLFLSPLLCSH